MARMSEKRLLANLIIGFLLSFYLLVYLIIHPPEIFEEAKVLRVIDGDTIVLEENESVRLIGINSPERGEKYYDEAADFLREMIEGATIEMSKDKTNKDKYYRLLRYIYVDDIDTDEKVFVNLEIVRNGLANVYIIEPDNKYEKKLRDVWQECLDTEINLCEPSTHKCSECIELEEYNSKKDEITLQNNCNFSCELSDWSMKPEGRKTFTFPIFFLGAEKKVLIKTGEGNNSLDVLFWGKYKNQDVWREDESVFLRDSDGKLVVYEMYE